MDSRQSAEVAIARVEGGGTAFAISSELILTAWHVVQSALQRDSEADAVRLKFTTGDLIEATLERHDADADVAVLRAPSPGLPPSLKPLPISTVVRYRQEWRAHGYPKAVRDRLTIDGTVTDPAARLKGSASAIQLRCPQAAARSPMPMSGFSGSPVIDQDSNMVIGIIRLEFRNPEGPGAVGGSIWAASLAHVARLWPDLIGPLVQRHRTELRAGLGELLLHSLSPSGELPKVRDLDAHAVGATLTRYSRQDNAPYVRRPQADTELSGLLRHQPAIVVVGPSSAGKSRTAFQAVLVNMPDAAFAHPRPTRQALRQLMRLDREEPLYAGPLVVWLDELDAYLNEDEVSPALVDWVQERDGGGVIVATMRDDQYTDLRGSAHKTEKGVRLFLDRLEDGYFFLSHQITMDEAALAGRLYPGQDFRDLQLGIGLKLIAGPELIARLRSAKASNPQGWAVVKAAVDYIWMGLPPPIPGRILRQLFDVAMRERSPQSNPDETAYRQGVTWACERAVSGVALLSATRSSDRDSLQEAFELVDQAEEFGLRHHWQIFAGSWQVALSTASMTDLLMVGAAARMRDEPTVAVSALHTAADQGSASAALELGLMLAGDGNETQARRWIGQAIQAGHPGAPAAMGLVLAQTGHLKEAREWLWRGVEAGAADAAFLMSQLAAREERNEEAAYWATIAACEGENEAWMALAQFSNRLGNEDAVTECLNKGAATSGVTAALCKYQLAISADDDQAASEWLQAAAELGDAYAARELGQMLADEERISEAEHWLRQAARSDPMALHDLGVLYEITGDIPAARDHYERAHRRKSIMSAVALARLSLAEGDVTGAVDWLRAEADAMAADPEAVCLVAFDLAQALRRQGQNTEAAVWLEKSAEAGYVPSMRLLGGIAMNARDAGTAEDWLMRAAMAGDHEAACMLGEVLDDKGETRRAACWLTVAAESERVSGLLVGQAAEMLAQVNSDLEAERACQPDPEADQLLADGIAAQERGAVSDAEFRFAMAAWHGSAEAAFRHARLLMDRDDKSGAVRSYRRAAERGHALAATALSMLTPDPLERNYWWQVACSAGEPVSLRALAQARLEGGDVAGAEALFRQLAEAGDLTAAGALGALLHSQGEPEEGREWLTKALDAQDDTIAAVAAHNLGGDALMRDDRVGAVAWYQRAAEAGWPASMVPLAMLLRDSGDSEQADALLMRAFENGDMRSTVDLGISKLESGDLDAALGWAITGAEHGNVLAAFTAGRLSYDAGNRDNAEKWLRVAADGGMVEAVVRLAALVARRGDLRAAEVILAGAVSQGDGLALYAAGDLAWRRGWMSAAEAYFAAAAEAGHLFAGLDAAALSDLRKDPEAKTHWLEQWQSAGTTSSLMLDSARNYYDIGLTILRNSPWEPGQPVTYGISTPIIQTWINSESGLDRRFDQAR